jgi:hypothetical protein
MATDRPILRGYGVDGFRNHSRKTAGPVAYHSAVRHDGCSAYVAAKIAQWQKRWQQRGYTPLVVYLAVLTIVVFYIAMIRS